jgi:hypothetical protein
VASTTPTPGTTAVEALAYDEAPES